MTARTMAIAGSALDKAIAVGAVILLAMVLAAMVRAAPTFPYALPTIWFHLTTVLIALALTPIMLLRAGRGDGLHRTMGYIWCVAMLLTALNSFLLRQLFAGNLSPIHILSVITLISLFRLIRSARNHDMIEHRRNVRVLSGVALLGAGLFTFPFGRMLGLWLFG